MESVIWAFKRLYDKGLTYQGFRVLPYCWKDETPLSNHELRMDDDVYRTARTRPSPSHSASPQTPPSVLTKVARRTRRRRSTRMDHHPLDPAHQPGARCRTRD